MKPVIAKVLKSAVPGSQVSVQGWIQSVRRMKNVTFVDIGDGSTPTALNLVFPNTKHTTDLNTGSCISVNGEVCESPGKQQQLELQAHKVEVLGPAGSDYPLQKKYHSREFLRQLPHLRWKTRQAQQILRYRSWALSQLQHFFTSRDVFQVNSPIITSSDCEGAGETFAIEGSKDFFKKPAYLSVSSQLHLEVYAASLSRVWNFAPAFRAEASDTNRHLSEFWMVEVELAFLESLSELTTFTEDMTGSILPSGKAAEDLLASKRNKEDREKLEHRWRSVEKPWTTLSYTEAIDLLNSHGKLPELVWGADLPSDHEKLLANEIVKGAVVVTDYPKKLKPFYMKQSSTNMTDPLAAPPTVACFDVLFPEIGEIVGGSMREDDYDTLLSNMKRLNMDTTSLEWYLELRRFGSFPHGGFGLGFERIVTFLTGMDNIRDATGFIRGFGQLPC